MKKPVHMLEPAYDVGTGKGNRVDYLANDVCGYNLVVNEGDACEAADNTADIRPLQDLGWNPTIDVVDYLKEKVGT